MKTTFNVTNQTSVQDLRNFLDQAKLDGNTKLRASDDGQGNITLYAKKGGTSLADRFKGLADAKRDLAHQTVGQIFKQATNLEAHALVGLEATLFAKTTANLRTDKLSVMVDFAANSTSTKSDLGALPQAVQQRVTVLVDQFKQDIQGGGGSNQDKRGVLEKQLAKDIATTLKQNDVTPGQRENLATSDGKPFARELMAMLREPNGHGPTNYHSDRSMSEMAGRVFADMACDLTGNQIIDDQTISVGGQTYKFQKDLGEGSFGHAALYKSTGNDGHQLVLKTSNNSGDNYSKADFDDFAGEARSQRAACSGPNNGNILPLEGVIRTPTGELALLTPLADHGDGGDTTALLRSEFTQALLGNSDYTPAQVRDMQLTQLKDMATGLNNLASQGFVHRDVKPQNTFVIGGDTFIADLGTTEQTTDFAPSQKAIANSTWQSPEALKLGEENDTFTREINKQVNTATTQAKKDFAGLFQANGGQLTARQKETRDVLANDVGTRERANLENIGGGMNMVNGEKSDVWAFGISVLQTLVGDKFNEFDFGSDHANFISRFGELPANTTALGQNGIWVQPNQPNDPGYTGDSPPVKGLHYNAQGDRVFNTSMNITTGDQNLDNFINFILRPKADDRPTFQQILNHPVMQNVNVGSPATKLMLSDFLDG